MDKKSNASKSQRAAEMSTHLNLKASQAGKPKSSKNKTDQTKSQTVAGEANKSKQSQRSTKSQRSVKSVKSSVSKPPFEFADLHKRLLEQRNKKAALDVDMSESEIKALLTRSLDIFASQPMLLELEPPICVAGDVHGQYSDVFRLFSYGGYPGQTNYLFLGDYIDRGRQSLETICLLFCYKVKFPENIFLLRGNHECSSINRVYGFYDECKRRFSVSLWKKFNDVFMHMPVAATIGEKILCMHGGISPDLRSLDSIREIERPIDVSEQGLICDLLWSDPDKSVRKFTPNRRGVSYLFGKSDLEKCLAELNLDLICRAHQVVEDGYEFFHDRRLVTIFSAPNYCGEYDNAAAIMHVSDELACAFRIIKPQRHQVSRKADIYESPNYVL